MPHEPSEAAVEAARDIVDRLKDHCTGHPDARIPWPHRVLHDAIAEIERLRRSASTCPAVSVETLRRFGYAPGGYLCTCKDCRRSHTADKKSWRCLACAAAAAETAPSSKRWRHKKRGTVYTEIGRADLQLASNLPLYEGTTLVVYRGDDGKLWARAEREFEDGRFEQMDQLPVSEYVRRAARAVYALDAPATPPAGTVPVLAGVGRDEDGKLMVYGGTNMTKDEIVDWFASCDYYDPHVYLTAMVPPESVVPELPATVEPPNA